VRLIFCASADFAKETTETAIGRLNHDASRTRSSIGGALQIDKDSKKGVQESVQYTLFAPPFGRSLSQTAA